MVSFIGPVFGILFMFGGLSCVRSEIKIRSRRCLKISLILNGDKSMLSDVVWTFRMVKHVPINTRLVRR